MTYLSYKTVDTVLEGFLEGIRGLGEWLIRDDISDVVYSPDFFQRLHHAHLGALMTNAVDIAYMLDALKSLDLDQPK